jgi:PAS domain S-box-containing protein
MDEQEVNVGQTFDDVVSYFRSRKGKYVVNSIIGLIFVTSLYLFSRVNYELFHSITAMIVIFITASVFLIIWNGRHQLDNQYYLFIGIAFLFFAFFNFLHMLGNKGMGVFPGFDNLGPTFYIIGGYILGISFLVAPIFLKRRLWTALVFAVYALLSTVILLSIFFWKNFPATYIEGSGLTRFKIISDYVVVVLLIGAIGLLWLNRKAFDAKIWRLLVSSLIVSILTGLEFTLYSDPFGIINAGGHFLQIAAYYLVFLAFIDTGLVRPQELLFRNLTQSNMAVMKLNARLAKVNSDLNASMAELNEKDLKLGESERKASSLIQYAPAAIFEMDIHERKFTIVNEALCQLCGYSRDELYTMDPLSLLDEMDGQAFFERVMTQMAGARPKEDFECKVRKKDGSAIYVALNFTSVDAAAGTALVIAHDINAARLHEDQLRESEQRFRTLSDTSPIGVSVASHDGIILYTNHTYDNLLGYEHEELIGTRAVNLYWNPEERAAWVSKVQSDGSIRNAELQLKSKDNKPVWVLINAAPISYGGAPALMGTALDISDRRKADDELKRNTAALEISNQELESFAYSLTHDLRAPLRALDGFSQAILDDYGDKLDATGNEFLARIRLAAQNMAQITEDMLKLSKVIRSDLHWEQVNLSDMVAEICEGLHNSEPERKMAIKIAPDVIVQGDPSLLHVALYNLVENAWKFSAKSAQAAIEFATSRDGGSDIYMLKDNGIGFDMKYADKLFQPFQRLHAYADYPGHGIGLATVQRVINRHGGKIWLNSEKGQGTTIYFTLGNSQGGQT